MVKANVDKILEILRQNKSASIRELSKTTGIKAEDIQKSAEYLEQDGVVKIENKFPSVIVTIVKDSEAKQKEAMAAQAQSTQASVNSMRSISAPVKLDEPQLLRPMAPMPQVPKMPPPPAMMPAQAPIIMQTTQMMQAPSYASPRQLPVMQGQMPPPAMQSQVMQPQGAAQIGMQGMNPAVSNPQNMQVPSMPTIPAMQSQVSPNAPPAPQAPPAPPGPGFASMGMQTAPTFSSNMSSDMLSSAPKLELKKLEMPDDPLDMPKPNFDLMPPVPSETTLPMPMVTDLSADEPFKQILEQKKPEPLISIEKSEKIIETAKPEVASKNDDFPSYIRTDMDKIEFLLDLIEKKIGHRDYVELNVIYRHAYELFNASKQLSPNELYLLGDRLKELFDRIRELYIVEGVAV